MAHQIAEEDITFSCEIPIYLRLYVFFKQYGRLLKYDILMCNKKYNIIYIYA